MEYVDGFIAAVPTANQGIYRDFALKAAALFREHGALRVVETWGDDVPEGQVTSFPMAILYLTYPLPNRVACETFRT
jgi:uncharacterized protein YbaA (DUF1428 family)